MLGYMREQRRSILIYAFFSIIIVTFVLSFGPGSGASCVKAGQSAAKVNGEAISATEFETRLVRLRELYGDRKDSKEMREQIMNGLITERLFAQAAHEAGFRASDEEVIETIEKQPQFQTKKTKAFSYERYKQIVNWGERTSVAEFEERTRRRLIAEKLDGTVRSLLWASEGELWSEFEEKNRTANLEYVAFDPKDYEKQFKLTPEEAQKWKTTKRKEIDDAFAKRKADYREYFVRQIVIGYEAGNDAKKDEARKKADEVRALAKSGDFAEVAKKESHDTTKEKGGELGWVKLSTIAADQVRNEVLLMKDGDVSRVVDEPGRFFVVKREKHRDVELKQVEDDLIADLARAAASKEKAKADAATLIAKAAADPKKSLKVAAGEDDAEKTKDNKDGKKAGKEKDSEKEKESRVKETGDFGWNAHGRLVGIGTSKALMKAAFKSLSDEKAVHPTPEEADGKVYVVRLVKRETPNAARFAEELKKKGLRKERLDMKGWQTMMGWQEAVRSRAKVERNTSFLLPERVEAPEKREGTSGASAAGAGAKPRIQITPSPEPARRDDARR
ncbi:MAG: SurA N-terminal domain-containing protein [Deltaproteobacteria bacterium]|nr:SurA N-terminal domain-containing protein [Deltaproteobacteria bacterium]